MQLPTAVRRTSTVVLGALMWAPECLLHHPEAVLHDSFAYSRLQNDKLDVTLLILSHDAVGESFLKSCSLCNNRADLLQDAVLDL